MYKRQVLGLVIMTGVHFMLHKAPASQYVYDDRWRTIYMSMHAVKMGKVTVSGLSKTFQSKVL